jgi:hypothetical protein
LKCGMCGKKLEVDRVEIVDGVDKGEVDQLIS